MHKRIIKRTIFFSIIVLLSTFFSCVKNKMIIKNDNSNTLSIEKIKFLPDKNDKVFSGNVILNSQLEIDEFGINKYTFIDGSLTINDTYEYLESIQNLNNLKSVLTINGDVIITRIKSLESVTGLKNLKKINSDFVISGCGLPQINDINNLEVINGNIIFDYNVGNSGENGLKEILGFNKLLSVKNIYISSNKSLKKIDAFNYIEEIGTIQIIYTDIDSITNFDNLKNVNKNFTIEYSNFLSKIYLKKLENINGIFGLNNNYQINGNIYLPRIKKINHLYLINNTNFDNYCVFLDDILNNHIDSLTAYKNKLDLSKVQIKQNCK